MIPQPFFSTPQKCQDSQLFRDMKRYRMANLMLQTSLLPTIIGSLFGLLKLRRRRQESRPKRRLIIHQ